MKLYELAHEINEIEIALELYETEGINETPQERESRLTAALDSAKLNFEEKINSIVKWTLNLNAEEDALANEVARLQKRKTAIANKKASLRNYILFCLKSARLTKIKTDIASVAVLKPRERVEVDMLAVESWPDEIKKQFVSYTAKVDKTGIKNYLLSHHLEGAKIELGDEGLSIR